MVDVQLPHCTFNHAIDLKGRTHPSWGPIYPLSVVKLKVLYENLNEILRIGQIQPSKSLAGAPILFILKAYQKGLRLCIDYQRLNKITVLNRYLLPCMNELRDHV
jgi:hypothetical protein